MTRIRAVLRKGPEVARDAVRYARAAAIVKASKFLSNPFTTNFIVGASKPKHELELSLERFRCEWEKRKPEPDEWLKYFETGYEFRH